jgi:hypothetical protein
MTKMFNIGRLRRDPEPGDRLNENQPELRLRVLGATRPIGISHYVFAIFDS